jgi:uncharacterized protein YbaA (DUF1428 family)/uncharacterized protein YndB with AHSA1/START domain
MKAPSSMKRLRFSVIIQAPRHKVWDTMIASDTYRQWTAGFCEGIYFEGSWEQGEAIRFLGPSGDGMIATIAENKLHERISIRLLARLINGAEDSFTEPAFENFIFRDHASGMELRIEMDTPPQEEAVFNEVWPKSLNLLKALCEKPHPSTQAHNNTMKTPGTYIDGFLLPVPNDKLEQYRQLAQQAGSIWMEHGALQYTECAADDLDTDFCRRFDETAAAQEHETVIFAWAVFADRAARDEANARIMADERLQGMCEQTGQIFDFKRMAFGGFKTIVSH